MKIRLSTLAFIPVALAVWFITVPLVERHLAAQVRPPRPAEFVAGGAPALQPNVLNPTTIEFTASADHNTIENGTAVVTRYDVQIFNSSAAVVATINTLGKPTPGTGGLITNTTLLRPATIGLPAGTYTAKVVAVGPGGSTPSAASNPFDLAPRSPTASGTPVIR